MTITNLITLIIMVVVFAIVGSIIGVLASFFKSAKAEMHNCKKNITQHKEDNGIQKD